MNPVVCPNCGSELSVSFSMPNRITCPACNASFGLEYDAVNPTFTEKLGKFVCTHKKGIATALMFATSLWKVYSYFHKEENLAEPESSLSSYNAFPESSDVSSTSADAASISSSTSMNCDNYDAKLVQHPFTIRNLGENRYPSAEKVQQAREMGINLGTHQTIVNSFPQTHYTTKAL